MMSAYANSVQKPERFDLYVRKFRSICMMHGVPMGSLKELPVFLRKLIDDRHLAMDFWGFIAKLSDREGGVLSDDQVLGVIVEGITDCDISEQDGSAQRIVGDLRAMLAGVDIQGPQYGQVEMAPFPKSDAAAQEREKHVDTREAEKPKLDKREGEKQLDGKWAHAEELAARSSDSQTPPPPPEVRVPLPVQKQAPSAAAGERPAPAPQRRESPEKPEKLDEELHHPAILPATPPPQLDEALLRLELTKLVQQYFDNIDKRISKLEPPFEEGAIAPPVTRRSLEEPISAEELEELRLRRVGKTRLVLEPASPPVEVPAHPAATAEDDDVPMRIPLEHYSPPPIYGRAPFLLMLVLIGSGFAIYRDPTLLRKGISFVVRQFHTDGRVASSNQDRTPAPASAPVSPATTQPSQPSVVQSVLEGRSSPPSAPEPEQRNSPPASQPAGAAAANDAGSGSGQKTVTDRAVAQTQQAVADTISTIESAGAIRVNPSVMDENLIVQRVPAYPEAAKLSGVQGDVVMQALISKEGTVKRVHVVEGDSRLRTAAEEAVYKWRYRPYVLHGQPVEVATTVTVNFNLDRR
jgi:TonB family protein